MHSAVGHIRAGVSRTGSARPQAATDSIAIDINDREMDFIVEYLSSGTGFVWFAFHRPSLPGFKTKVIPIHEAASA